jgi:hypothetical protein
MGEAVDNLVALSLAGEFPNLTAEDIDFIALAGKLDWSPKENWIDKAGGLPKYIEDIALALIRDHGMTRSRAIATAINRVKKWSAGVGDTNADTKAKAAKAVAQWEKMKASAKAKKGAK